MPLKLTDWITLPRISRRRSLRKNPTGPASVVAPPTGVPQQPEISEADETALRENFFRRLVIAVAAMLVLLAVVLGLGAAFHTPAYALIGSSIAAVALTVGPFVTISKDDIYKLGASKRAVKVMLSVAGAAWLVAAGVIVIGYWTHREIVVPPTVGTVTAMTSGNSASPSASASSSPNAPDPETGSLTRDGHCNPPNPSDWKIPDYELCVIAWCRGIVVFPNGSIDESRIQVKVRPRITNNTGSPVDVTIWKTSALRLLVRSSDMPDSWEPPKETAKLSDTPYLVLANDGQQYWAVAPNIPKDVDLPDDTTKPTEIGFATFWSASSIAHDSAYPPLTQGYDENGRLDQDGDLVFQLPATTASNHADFVALVLVDRAKDPTKILATAWFQDWGPKQDPNSF